MNKKLIISCIYCIVGYVPIAFGADYRAGNNIQINGTTISKTDTKYAPGPNIQITGDKINKTDTKYTSGTGINISDNKINIIYDNDTIKRNNETGELYTDITTNNIPRFVQGDNIIIDPDGTINATIPTIQAGSAINVTTYPDTAYQSGRIDISLKLRDTDAPVYQDGTGNIYIPVDNVSICYDSDGTLTTQGCSLSADYNAPIVNSTIGFCSVEYGYICSNSICTNIRGEHNADYTTTTIKNYDVIQSNPSSDALYCYCKIYTAKGTNMPRSPWVFADSYTSYSECKRNCVFCDKRISSNKNYRAAIYAASGIANSGN